MESFDVIIDRRDFIRAADIENWIGSSNSNDRHIISASLSILSRITCQSSDKYKDLFIGVGGR
jgi:hypothetical protein